MCVITNVPFFFHHISKMVKVLTFNLAQNWCLSQCRALQPPSVFKILNSSWSTKAIHNSLWLLSCRMPFTNFLCMHTCSLIPRLKIAVIGLGARLLHKQNHKLTSGQYAQLAWSLHVVVGKAYEPHCIQLPSTFTIKQLTHSFCKLWR